MQIFVLLLSKGSVDVFPTNLFSNTSHTRLYIYKINIPFESCKFKHIHPPLEDINGSLITSHFQSTPAVETLISGSPYGWINEGPEHQSTNCAILKTAPLPKNNRLRCNTKSLEPLAEKGERNLPLIWLIFPLTPSRSATRRANHLFVLCVFI